MKRKKHKRKLNGDLMYNGNFTEEMIILIITSIQSQYSISLFNGKLPQHLLMTGFTLRSQECTDLEMMTLGRLISSKKSFSSRKTSWKSEDLEEILMHICTD